MALPFFRNTLAGDFIYTGMFFGVYNLGIIFTEKYLLQRRQIV
jgi:hypothetical protein